jgi:hypothetical protein
MLAITLFAEKPEIFILQTSYRVLRMANLTLRFIVQIPPCWIVRMIAATVTQIANSVSLAAMTYEWVWKRAAQLPFLQCFMAIHSDVQMARTLLFSSSAIIFAVFRGSQRKLPISFGLKSESASSLRRKHYGFARHSYRSPTSTIA